ncbi:piggyBac transposable element-derived protein 4 isoform X2 [Harpegnathos saltator]|uniref:piggyBac transposable element-derived protein 4 isoform X2 n=1 Tax=Harpegnathos saltator TaxID=610380 RepID=UPI00058EFD86|nr:piggyBac transposable element-derived protein 4 isoform X2 [Harpegnathos saltator]
MDKIKNKVNKNIEFESSSDEYVCELEAELQDLSEDENFHDSGEEILAVSRRRDLRIIYSSDSEEECSANAISFLTQSDESPWLDVTEEDNYNYNINFSTGGNNTGPHVPSNCTTPLHFFQLFFTDDLIKKIVIETNIYTANIIQHKQLSIRSIWKQWKNVTECEMKAFFGVIINMGLINMPSLQDYWARNFYSKIPFFSKIFSRDRFMQIFWALHLETLPRSMNMTTKTRKISSYLDFLNKKFMEHYIPEKNLSIDESTVGFKGRVSFRTYNMQKPTKWGLRVYILADTRTSYLYSFVPFYGKITINDLIRPDLSFTNRIVLQLYDNLQKSIPGATGYHIFTDKFYTNPILATELLKQQCFLTGTISINRKGISKRIRKCKLAIGQSIAYRREKTLLLAWRHKRVVTMLSTKHTSGMLTRPKERFSREPNSGEQLITKPRVIFDYTDNNVNTADQYAVSYCFIRKTLKWWRKLFFWGFESAIVNAYILYKECAVKNDDIPITHLQFRKKLLMELIGDFRAPKLRSEPVSDSDKEQRLENIPHFIFQLSGSKTKDCVVCSKPNVPGERKRTSYFCDTCERKPGLHPGNCFKRYHTLKSYKM